MCVDHGTLQGQSSACQEYASLFHKQDDKALQQQALTSLQILTFYSHCDISNHQNDTQNVSVFQESKRD